MLSTPRRYSAELYFAFRAYFYARCRLGSVLCSVSVMPSVVFHRFLALPK